MGKTTHTTDSSNTLNFISNTTMDNTTTKTDDVYKVKNDT